MRPAASLIFVYALVAQARGDEPRPGPPADFKVQIENFGARKEPVRRAELIVRKGRAYWLMSDSNEVAVYEPAAGQIELLDLERMERTDLPLKKLDEALTRWRGVKLTATDKLQRAGGRANTLAAGMGRDLIEPKMEVTFDAASNRLRMSNPSVDVDATGEPEPDPVRRAFEADSLAWFLKLETIRNPEALPPYCALDALRGLTRDRTLRPLEITFLFRLAGPPLKVRWTYRLLPSLTAREHASVSKIDVAREHAKFVRFDRYEEEDAP
ncbi:MAG: hypothetical protein P4L84_00805 [Isosphaeraceae bacterium]|nr:hypothetical protein [Isosphaeraceae bacterium]